jgi:hypothetical protein
MTNEKLTPKEWLVIGALSLGVFSLGASFTAFTRLNVNGRFVPPNPVQGNFLLLIAIITLIATIVLAVKNLGTKEGLKMLGREAWPALLFGGGVGAITCFFLRAIFPGFIFYFMFLLVYGIGAYVFLRLKDKAELNRA